MNILLTNDDGIHAEGLWAVQKALSAEHEVCVVAPDKERSAVGHSITLMHPLIINKVHTNGGWGYAVSGTPADCVKLAVREILDTRPDMVVSGINPGPNVGINIHYSGTVSAAKEAALMGLKAIAVSQGPGENRGFEHTAAFVSSLIRRIMDKGLPAATFLNVNVPACAPEKIKGVRITRQAIAPLREKFHKRIDPRNRTYYWQGMDTQVLDEAPDTDGTALGGNCISITPIRCDMTDYDAMEQLESWNLKM
ncbi:MAG: 5'/3'-nucleotidase SurE [Deltaproteobacteria bacterium]|nr:5'/3'-nucleotidase SurE [Deltaproteobacteria bacterium]